MIVCPEVKLAFLHLPRTGGTSIGEALRPHASINKAKWSAWKPRDMHWTEPHSSFDENERWLRANKGYTVAAFVRSPWSRMVSMYRGLPDGAKTFDEYLARWPQAETAEFFKPWQAQFVGESDFIGKFETLQADFDRLCDRVGLPRQELARLSARRPGSAGWNYQSRQFAPIIEQPWEAAYSTQQRIDRVSALCSEDIERFGYEPPPIWQEK